MHFKHNFFFLKKSVENDPVWTPSSCVEFFFDGFPNCLLTAACQQIHFCLCVFKKIRSTKELTCSKQDSWFEVLVRIQCNPFATATMPVLVE